ncbi:MAG: T6SS immunity protein Tdi1 domain-containing protein [Trichloromonadaceae bacterium]
MNKLIEIIEVNWSWVAPEPKRIVQINKFGNIIFEDTHGKYWRICPEDLNCKNIAENLIKFKEILVDKDFAEDWRFKPLSDAAESKFGIQLKNRCFCLKIPAVLGGEYSIENVVVVEIEKLIIFSGDLARRIKDLSDGESIEFKPIET